MSLSNNKTRISVVITKGLKEEITKLAQKDNRSMGNYISVILEDHVKKNQNKNPSDK